MNRLARSGSLLFEIGAWCLLIALLCDGANLDDLSFDSIVLHNDEEIAASCTIVGIPADVSQNRHLSIHAVGIRHLAPLPRPLARVIIDQDSPSLSADKSSTSFLPLFLHNDAFPATSARRLPSTLLHLLFHSLLI